MRFYKILLSVSLALSGMIAHAQAPDIAKISNKLLALDIGVSDIAPAQRSPDSPLPNSYDEHISFSIKSVAPKGGQLFTCSKPKYCEAIYSYFDAFRGLAGPYIFKSGDGLVVAQLNSGLPVKEAEKIESILLDMK